MLKRSTIIYPRYLLNFPLVHHLLHDVEVLNVIMSYSKSACTLCTFSRIYFVHSRPPSLGYFQNSPSLFPCQMNILFGCTRFLDSFPSIMISCTNLPYPYSYIRRFHIFDNLASSWVAFHVPFFSQIGFLRMSTLFFSLFPQFESFIITISS